MKTNNTTRITIATVFANLLNKYFVVNTHDESLVVEALRRSNNALDYASLTDLADYLNTLDQNQLEGLAHNIKGIYHELKYADNINNLNNGISAELYEHNNHAGADIMLKDSSTGELINEVQLKATDSSGYIAQHYTHYPDIDVVATSEIAESLDHVQSSGLSNQELTRTIEEQFAQLSDISTQTQVIDAAATSGLLSAALRASEVLSGKKQPLAAGKDALADISIATGTTALSALLFS